MSSEHFTVDGTLIESWASLKSFKSKDDDDQTPPDDPGNPTVDFHGEKRSNETDPDAKLARKGKGKEAKLSYSAHALIENRNGLVLDLQMDVADGYAERRNALEMLDNIDARTTGHAGYAISQRVRKRVEEVFGWIKTVGNFRKSRYIGLGANQVAAYVLASAYNLLRIAKLLEAA